MQRLVININQKKDNKIIFTDEQSHYIFRVLRLGNNDKIIVMNGIGNSWLVELQEGNGQILESIEVKTELPFDVTLLVALPKGNGFDEIVRCCTELGVKTIIPLQSDRTLLKPSVNKLQRWRKIAQEAAEQSERQIVPNILEPTQFKKILINISEKKDNCYICVARSDSNHLINYLEKNGQNIIIATGPEGGWTKAEIEQAINHKFKPVSLGNRVLRAITAPIAAMSIIAAMEEKSSKYS